MDHELLRMAWTQTWQVSLLILAVAGLARLLGRNHPHFAHALWIVVFVKAVTPPLWTSSAGVFSRLQTPPEPPEVEVAEEPPEPEAEETPEPKESPIAVSRFDPELFANARVIPLEERRPLPPRLPAEAEVIPVADVSNVEGAAAAAAVPGAAVTPKPVENKSKEPIWSRVLLIVWAVGAVGSLLLAWVRWLLCKRAIRRADKVHDPELQELLQNLARRIGLRRKVRLIISKSRIGPAVWGVVRPVVLIPYQVIQGKRPAELEPILAHELIHVRRGDLWVGWFGVLVQAVWWFHPLVWWAGRLIKREAERCCDEEVVAELGMKPARYARALLDVLEQKQTLKTVPVLPGVKPVEITSKRLERIMLLRHGCRKRTPWWCYLVMLLAAATTLPGAAFVAQAKDKPNRKAREKQTTKASQTDAFRTRRFKVGDVLERYQSETRLQNETVARSTLAEFLKNMVGELWSEETPLADGEEAATPAIAIKGNTLRVRHTPRVLDRIAEELEILREHGFAQIAIEARIITAGRDVVEKAVSDWEVLPSEGPERKRLETEVDNGVRSTTEKSAPLRMAILKDPEAKKMIEACQSDARSNLMFCPKVTVFNGQHATIQSTVQRPFVVGISSDGKPTIRVVEEGTKIRLRAIWKGDHIRLESQVTLADIRNVDVVDLPGKPGEEPSPKVQVPELATTRINNTVKLPSGGSVLLGGLNLPDKQRVTRGRGIVQSVSDAIWPENAVWREKDEAGQQLFVMLRVVHLSETKAVPKPVPSATGIDFALPLGVRTAQSAARLAELEYQKALEANRRSKGAVSQLEVERLKLKAELAQLRVEQLKHELELKKARTHASEFDAKTGSSMTDKHVTVAVVCSAPKDIKWDYANLDHDLAKKVANWMSQKKIKVIDPDRVRDWLDRNPDRDSPDEIGAAFGVTYVVQIGVNEFTLYEQNSSELYRGRSNVLVKVWQMDGENGEQIFSRDVKSIYPLAVPRSTYDTTYTTFKREFTELLSGDIGQLFYESHNAEDRLKAEQMKKPMLLYFEADWCGPCRQMNPIVSRLKRQGYPVQSVNVDKERELAQRYNVTKMPTFILVVEGKERQRLVGMQSESQLRRLVAQIPSDSNPPVELHPAKATPYSTLPYHGQPLIGTGVNSDAGVTGSIVIDEKNFDLKKIEPPTKAEVLEAVRNQCQKKNIAAPKNVAPNSVAIETDIDAKWTEPQRFYPKVGLAREHRVRFKCTVKMEETITEQWPIPAHHTRPREHVVFVEKTQLVIDEAIVPEAKASEKGDGQTLPSAYYLADDVQYLPDPKVHGGVTKSDAKKDAELAKLVSEFNKLFDQRRYQEAEKIALKAKELDPESPTAQLMFWKSRFVVREMNSEALKEEARAQKKRSENEEKIEATLKRTTTLKFTKTPLSEVVKHLATQHDMDIVVDNLGLSEEGVTADEPVSINVEGVKLSSALSLILKPLQLNYHIEDEVLKITSQTRIDLTSVTVRTYPVADLVVPVPNFAAAAVDLRVKPVLAKPESGKSERPVPPPANAKSSPEPGKEKAWDFEGRIQPKADERTAIDFDDLTKLITSSVEPNSWAVNGGIGSIRGYETTLSLVIRQSDRVHEQVAEVLEQLRQLQDVQVSLQAQTIEVADALDSKLLKSLKAGKPVTVNGDELSEFIKTAAKGGTLPNITSQPKMTIFNGQTVSVILPAADEDGMKLDLSPVSTADRRFVRLHLALSSDPAEGQDHLSQHHLKDGHSLLLDVTKYHGDKSGKRQLLLITPTIIVQEEEEELLGKKTVVPAKEAGRVGTVTPTMVIQEEEELLGLPVEN